MKVRWQASPRMARYYVQVMSELMRIDATMPPLKRQGFRGGYIIDRVFRWSTFTFAIVIPLLILVLGVVLSKEALPAIRHFGVHFLTHTNWDPVADSYGILFAIFGTLVSSFLALLIAVPISLGAAVFLAELAPSWIKGPVSFLIELLAAVPSIVYGLWGLFVLVPLLRPFELWLGKHFGYIPLFQGPAYGIGMLAAGLVLAIMILPYITSVSREVIQAVPQAQREASLALGATYWETIRGPVLRYARSGILGAIILGLGRAIGETMAVTMVIGNRVGISYSLFSPGYTMPSLLANEFNEATGKLHLAALVEVALVLVIVTIIINAIARLLIWQVSKEGQLGGSV